MTGDTLLPSANSPAFLPERSPLRRRPRAPGRHRPESFERDEFEGRALVYDTFWHADGRRVLLVGPAALNLRPALTRARYIAIPSRKPLSARTYDSLSVRITALADAPADTTAIEMLLDGEKFVLPVQPNVSPTLAGARVLFTVSRDNELAWIADWAHYHARLHGTDAVVFFDNGSTRYAPAEIAATLGAIPGIRHAAVLAWPYRYGPFDAAVKVNPYYALFLQIAAMSVTLRRYAAAAYGLLNSDVDELVAAPPGTTIYDLAHAAPHGLVTFGGQFVEAVPAGQPLEGEVLRHRDFASRLRDSRARASRPRKWALDPQRAWVQNLGVHPYMHWIEGRPLFGKTTPAETFYWHFRGISTNWKDRRTDASHLAPEAVEVDRALEAWWRDSEDR
jgi:hypothetical protein